MKYNILFHGYSLVKNDRAIPMVFPTKIAAITYHTGIFPNQKAHRAIAWNEAKAEGWSIKPVFVAVN